MIRGLAGPMTKGLPTFFLGHLPTPRSGPASNPNQLRRPTSLPQPFQTSALIAVPVAVILLRRHRINLHALTSRKAMGSACAEYILPGLKWPQSRVAVSAANPTLRRRGCNDDGNASLARLGHVSLRRCGCRLRRGGVRFAHRHPTCAIDGLREAMGFARGAHRGGGQRCANRGSPSSDRFVGRISRRRHAPPCATGIGCLGKVHDASLMHPTYAPYGLDAWELTVGTLTKCVFPGRTVWRGSYLPINAGEGDSGQQIFRAIDESSDA
jgi:hypothetical protein